MKRSEELAGYLQGHKNDIEKYQQEILEYGVKIGKMAAKGKVDEVIELTWYIDHRKESITSTLETIERVKELIEEALRQESGLGIVSDALNEILKSDLEWHKEIRKQYTENYKEFYERYKKGEFTPSVYALAQMGEKQARKVFLDDLRYRFNTLKDRILKKVTEVQEVNIRRNGNYSFDGSVKGTTGIANISTVVAGGYNIQRLHLRTLVK